MLSIGKQLTANLRLLHLWILETLSSQYLENNMQFWQFVNVSVWCYISDLIKSLHVLSFCIATVDVESAQNFNQTSFHFTIYPCLGFYIYITSVKFSNNYVCAHYLVLVVVAIAVAVLVVGSMME